MLRLLSALGFGLIFCFNVFAGVIRLDDEGTKKGYIAILNCTGSGVSCTKSGITGTLNAPNANFGASIDDTELTAEDFGGFTCTGAEDSCTINSNVGSFTKSFMITSPTATADGAVWRVPAACTIIAVHGVQVGGTNVVGHLTECDADGLNPAGVDGATDMTILTTNVNDDGSLSNPSIDSGDYIGWRTTSVTGTITRVTISFEGTWD